MRTLVDYLKRIAIGGVSLLAAAALLVVGAPTAQAHELCTVHADSSYVCLGIYHEHLTVCDRDADGNYAYARTYRNGVVQPALYDHNGAAAGCSSYEARVTSLDSFNVCVQNEGCGSPIYWWQF